ncbi:MAG: hypothetical protein V1658_01710, partial [Candidatus Micrarchaeota archaeon]
ADCDAGTWSTYALWSTTQLGGTDTRWGKIFEDPTNFGNLTLLGNSQTAAGGWNRARVYCDVSGCFVTEDWVGFGAATSAAFDTSSFAFDKYPLSKDFSGLLCDTDGTYYMVSSDGNFRMGVVYSDENSNSAYDAGDNIIFCTDFNPNKLNYLGEYSDYEIAFPKSFADNVDMYLDG